MTPEKNPRKGGGVSVMWSPIFWALNANSSKIAKGSNFKFGTHARFEAKSRHDPWKNLQKGGRSQGHVTPSSLVLNANSSKMAKDTNFII